MAKSFNDLSQLTRAILKKEEPKAPKPAPVRAPIPHPVKKPVQAAVSAEETGLSREDAACLDYFSHTSLTARGFATEGRTRVVAQPEARAKSAECVDASLVGRTFVHFKGGRYRLEGYAKDSETLEILVVYRALYGEGGLWVRPAKMFFEQVEKPGYSGPRFKLEV